MDDPLSRILHEDEQKIEQESPVDIENDVQHVVSSLSISHTHNEWILPSTNQNNEEAEIFREKVKIIVTEPKKHKTNIDSFISYLITTRTFNDGVQIKESNVRRRYKDFFWLRTHLEQKYPFHILSPLPMKHSISKKLNVVADDGEFIRRRMIGLENFLQRLMENSVISIDPTVQSFLNVDDETFHSIAQEQNSTNGSISLSTNNNNFFRPQIGRGKTIPSEFSRTENQIQTLQENLRKLERLSRKIESDEINVLNENEQFLSSLKQWLDCERKHDQSEKHVEPICLAQETLIQNQRDLLKDLNVKYLEPINEYVLYTGVVQEILKRRSQLAEAVTNNPDEVSFDQLTIANETIKADFQRWTELKDKEFLQLFRSMAEKKVEFYTKSAEAWERAAAQFSSNSQTRS